MCCAIVLYSYSFRFRRCPDYCSNNRFVRIRIMDTLIVFWLTAASPVRVLARLALGQLRNRVGRQLGLHDSKSEALVSGEIGSKIT